MNTILKSLKALFRRPPVVVTTYKRSNTDAARKRRELHRQLARELGLPEPML